MRLTELYTKKLEKIHGSFEKIIANFLKNPWMDEEQLEKYAGFIKEENGFLQSINNYNRLYVKTVYLIENPDSDQLAASEERVNLLLKQLKIATKYVSYELKLELLPFHNYRYLHLMPKMGFVFSDEEVTNATNFIETHGMNLNDIITNFILIEPIVVQYEHLFKDVLDAVMSRFEQQWHFLKSFHSLMDPEFRGKFVDSYSDLRIHVENLKNRYVWAIGVELKSPGELARIQQSYLNSISRFNNGASGLGFSFTTLEEAVCKDPAFSEKAAMFLELKKVIVNFQSCKSAAEYRGLQVDCCDRHIETLENDIPQKRSNTAALFSRRNTSERHREDSALPLIPQRPQIASLKREAYNAS